MAPSLKAKAYWPDPLLRWSAAVAWGLGVFALSALFLSRAPRLFFVPPVLGGLVLHWRSKQRMPGLGLPKELAQRVSLVAERERLIFQQLRRLPSPPIWTDNLPRIVAHHHATAKQLAEAEALLASEPPSALAEAEAEYQSSLMAAPDAADELRRRGAALEARRQARQELVELTVRTSLRLGLLEDTLAVMATGAITASEPSPQLQAALFEADAAMAEASAEMASQREIRSFGLSKSQSPPNP